MSDSLRWCAEQAQEKQTKTKVIPKSISRRSLYRKAVTKAVNAFRANAPVDFYHIAADVTIDLRASKFKVILTGEINSNTNTNNNNGTARTWADE